MVGAGVFAESDPRRVWTRYCGFLDLGVRDFMDIQEHLLMEQVGLIARSALGRRLLRGSVPSNLSDFRVNVPLTSFGDYLPFLGPGHDDVLTESVAEWAHTTGAQAGFKWVPYTQRGLDRLLDNLMGAFILAAASRHGDVNIWPGDTALCNTPERPYLSGLATFGMRERFGFRTVLDPEVSERLDFKERIRQGFQEALAQPVDVIIAMTSVLAKVGEEFAEHAHHGGLSRRHLRPRAMYRLARAYLKSFLLRRPVLPGDLWPAKAILGWGVDTAFFADKVRRYWGRAPFEVHACTEGGIMGMQTWERLGMALNPYADFYEFIPMAESQRSREDSRYRPRTLLLTEVTPGETYEMVITNFYGMAFVRYRVGHLVRFLPQDPGGLTPAPPRYTFLGRSDDRIDLAGFTRIDEKSVWDCLNLADLPVEDWCVRKEFEGDIPVLHVYIELRREGFQEEAVREGLHQAMGQVDPFYGDLERFLGILPLRVTCLPRATFEGFYDRRRAAGEELGRRRPARMNASDEDVGELLRGAG